MTAGAPDVSTQRRRWVVPALHLVSAVMIVAMLYTGASVWRFLRPAGVLLPLTGHAAATAFVADLAGCVWSFFGAGQWPLKTIFAIVFFLWCTLLLFAIGAAAGARGAFPGVLLP